jgi:hypothetical protein
MKRTKNLKITPNTHKILKEYCEENGLKMFQYVETLIKRSCILNNQNKNNNNIYGEQ